MKWLIRTFGFLLFLSLACVVPATPSTTQIQNVPSGGVILQDDFSQPANDWNTFNDQIGQINYDGGTFRFFVNALNTNFWSTPRLNLTDARIEVDAGKIGGPDQNRIGLICRFSNDKYYFFMITSDGFYGIGIFANGQAVLLGQTELYASANINKGMAINHLRADCVGDTFTFYINGFETATVRDATLKSGDVGLLAGTFDKPGVDIIFDKFVVIKP